MTKLKLRDIFAFSFLTLFSLAVLILIEAESKKEKIFYSDFFQPSSLISMPETKRFLEQKEIITLMFVGDIMLDRGVEYMIEKYGKGDYYFPFLKIASDFKKADILFGNLESVISDKGRKVGSIYSFRANPEAIKGLVFAGFDIVSVANNHIFDYGREAMEDSFKRLNEAGIGYIGAGFSETQAHSPVIKEINQTKIAFLAYNSLGSKYWIASENQSGIAWLDEGIGSDIRMAREKADMVIVSMHFGEEYRNQPSLEQELFARLAIDSGADLVIGHHPHVVQPIEKYKQGYIAYSLGNFIFDQGFSIETMQGLLLKVSVKNKKILEVIPRNIEMNDFFQPEIKLYFSGRRFAIACPATKGNTPLES